MEASPRHVLHEVKGSDGVEGIVWEGYGLKGQINGKDICFGIFGKIYPKHFPRPEWISRMRTRTKV